jgi:hypothetical protein
MMAALAASLAGGSAVAAPPDCGTVVMPLNDISSMSPLYGFTNGYNGDAVDVFEPAVDRR